MNEAMIERLKKLAKSDCFYDDEDEDKMVNDYAGGNIDDAFSCGETAGEVMLAREVLKALDIKWY